jgi:hypothetical protein
MSGFELAMTIFALGALAALAGQLSQEQDDLSRPMVFACWVAAVLLMLGTAAICYCVYLMVTGRLA